MAELDKAAVESSKKLGFSPKTLDDWMKWERASISDVTPINPMVDFVKRIQDAGISVNVMTARSQRTQKETMDIVESFGIRAKEVFFRPQGPDFETIDPSQLKSGMIRQSMDRYNYIAFLDDNPENLKAGFKLGIPLAIQPAASDILPEEAMARGLIIGQQNMPAGRMRSGAKNLEALIDITGSSRKRVAQEVIQKIDDGLKSAGGRTGIMAPGTFRKLVESMEVAQNILKGRF